MGTLFSYTHREKEPEGWRQRERKEKRQNQNQKAQVNLITHSFILGIKAQVDVTRSQFYDTGRLNLS